MNAKKQIAELRKEMKSLGVRIVSCFNGGLTRDELYYNTRLYELKCKAAKGL